MSTSQSPDYERQEIGEQHSHSDMPSSSGTSGDGSRGAPIEPQMPASAVLDPSQGDTPTTGGSTSIGPQPQRQSQPRPPPSSPATHPNLHSSEAQPESPSSRLLSRFSSIALPRVGSSQRKRDFAARTELRAAETPFPTPRDSTASLSAEDVGIEVATRAARTRRGERPPSPILQELEAYSFPKSGEREKGHAPSPTTVDLTEADMESGIPRRNKESEPISTASSPPPSAPTSPSPDLDSRPHKRPPHGYAHKRKSRPRPKAIHIAHHKLRSLKFRPNVVLQNSGSVARDHLANERTFLAYVRTSVAIASAGVALVQLFTLSRHISSGEIQGRPLSNRVQRFAVPLGATLIITGFCILLIGLMRYFFVQDLLPQGKFRVARMSTLFISFAISVVVVITFGVLVGSDGAG